MLNGKTHNASDRAQGLGVGFILLFFSLCQGAILLTPEKAVSITLQNNKQLQAAQWTAKVTNEAQKEAFARLGPALSGNANFKKTSGVPKISITPEALGPVPTDFTDSLSRRAYRIIGDIFDGISQSIPMGSTNNYSIGLSLQQPIFSGFKIINAYRLADARCEANKLELKKMEQRIAYSALALFWTVYFLERSIALAQDAENQYAVMKQNQELKLTQKLIAEYELLQIQASYAKAKAATIQAQQRFHEGERSLCDLLSLDPGENIKLMATIEDSVIMGEFGTIQAYMASVCKERPDLLEFDQEMKIAKLNERIDKADYLPIVGLSGEFSYARPNPLVSMSDAWKHSWCIQVFAIWNIFDWGAAFHRGKQSEYHRKAFEETQYAAKREIVSQALAAWESVKAYQMELVALKEATRACEAKQKAMSLHFQQNLITTSEFLNTQLELTQTRFAEYSARAKLIVAIENMKIGGLGAQ